MPGRRDPQRMESRMPDPRMLPSSARGDDEMDIDYAAQPRQYDDNRGIIPDRPPYHDGRQPYAEPNGYRGPSGHHGYIMDQRDPRDRDPRDSRGAPDPRDIRDMRDYPRGAIDPRADPRTDPRLDYRADPRLDPRADPRFDPRVDPRIDPRVQPQYQPGTPGQGYPRQQDPTYYPPTTVSYGGPPMNAAPMQPPYGANTYAPGPTPGQMTRENARDTRYNGPPGYPNDLRNDPRNGDPRYAYPSPPVTIVDTRDTSPNTVPPPRFVHVDLFYCSSLIACSGYPSMPSQGSMQSRYDHDSRRKYY